MPGLDPPIRLGEARAENLPPTLLLCPLGLARVSTNATGPLATGDGQALADLRDGPPQRGPFIEQAPQGKLVLILRQASHRPGPPGR
ncbi:hypothetical protein [Streptomyces sp. TBY4]|uniref:hypothetical protein n=1 Tax=Streptomyces sp. TBY4 TaxID=2962030 RepID=UPI0020B82044|nr:hypothetical protein [Streptomyces sp. TBY4]MCP3756358.1 hypothetical protein [Streptomyces sp. TBY4]